MSTPSIRSAIYSYCNQAVALKTLLRSATPVKESRGKPPYKTTQASSKGRRGFRGESFV